MATSKNQKSGTKGKNNFVAEKKIKKVKETILVEITKEVISKMLDGEKDGTIFVDTYEGKEVLSVIMRYGKKYMRLKNI